MFHTASSWCIRVSWDQGDFLKTRITEMLSVAMSENRRSRRERTRSLNYIRHMDRVIEQG